MATSTTARPQRSWGVLSLRPPTSRAAAWAWMAPIGCSASAGEIEQDCLRLTAKSGQWPVSASRPKTSPR